MRVAENRGFRNLLRLLDPNVLKDDPLTVNFAAKVLGTLAEEAALKPHFANFPEIVPLLVGLIDAVGRRVGGTPPNPDLNQDIETVENVAEILEVLVCDTESIPVRIVVDDYLPLLLGYLERQLDCTGAVKPDDLRTRWLRTRGVVTRIIIDTTLSDANMDVLFNNAAFLNRMCGWLERCAANAKITAREESADLIVCSALCLGNLVRSERNCVTLVRVHQVAGPVLTILRRFTVDGGGENPMPDEHAAVRFARVRHACVSLLKNLAIPAANKDILGNAGAIAVTAPLCSSNVQPVQAAEIVLLKHLCNGNDTNAFRIAEDGEPTALVRIAEVVSRTEDPATKSEGTRALVNLVKVAWSTTTSLDFPDEQGELIKRKQNLQNALLSEKVILPIGRMACDDRYPMLQNEAINALTVILCGDGSQGKAAELDAVLEAFCFPNGTLPTGSQPSGGAPLPSLPPAALSGSQGTTRTAGGANRKLSDAVIKIFANSDSRYPEEMRLNALVLLERLFDLTGETTDAASAADCSAGQQKLLSNELGDVAHAGSPPLAVTAPPLAPVFERPLSPPTAPAESAAQQPQPVRQERGHVWRLRSLTVSERTRCAQAIIKEVDEALRVLADPDITGTVNPRLAETAKAVLRAKDRIRC